MPLLIDYDSSLVPDGGCHVYASIEVVKQVNKEAAGHIFHERALLQAGFIGECFPFKPTMATCFRAIHSSDGLLHSAAVVGRFRGGNSLTQTMIHWSLVPLPRLLLDQQEQSTRWPPPARSPPVACLLPRALSRSSRPVSANESSRDATEACQLACTGSDCATEDDATTAEVRSSASRASLLDDTVPEG